MNKRLCTVCEQPFQDCDCVDDDFGSVVIASFIQEVKSLRADIEKLDYENEGLNAVIDKLKDEIEPLKGKFASLSVRCAMLVNKWANRASYLDFGNFRQSPNGRIYYECAGELRDLPEVAEVISSTSQSPT